jgi:hypothetical protein
MKKALSLPRNLLNFSIPFGLLIGLVFLMQSPFVIGNDTLILAITADLLLTVPFVYFLLIRKSQIPKTTVVPVMLFGLLLGTYYLPKEGQSYLILFKNWALPVIELSILTLILFKIRKAIHSYKQLSQATPDFYDTLKRVCSEILPQPLVRPFATEVAVFYYGFIHWKKREIQPNEFTYHQKSGTFALFMILIMIIGIETLALHILLALWNTTAAWILTALSLYTAIQFFGFAKALAQRPIVIKENTLYLRYSIMKEAKIPLAAIQSITLSKKALENNSLSQKLSPLGELESHNVIIQLQSEQQLIGLYGLKKTFKTIGLYVDAPEAFKALVEGEL